MIQIVHQCRVSSFSGYLVQSNEGCLVFTSSKITEVVRANSHIIQVLLEKKLFLSSTVQI